MPPSRCMLCTHAARPAILSRSRLVPLRGQDAIAVEEHELKVRAPGALTLKYRFKVGEEVFKAPMVGLLKSREPPSDVPL